MATYRKGRQIVRRKDNRGRWYYYDHESRRRVTRETWLTYRDEQRNPAPRFTAIPKEPSPIARLSKKPKPFPPGVSDVGVPEISDELLDELGDWAPFAVEGELETG